MAKMFVTLSVYPSNANTDSFFVRSCCCSVAQITNSQFLVNWAEKPPNRWGWWGVNTEDR